MHKRLEDLPEGPAWYSQSMKFEWSRTLYQVRFRDIKEAIAYLWGNPNVVEHLVYRARRTRGANGGLRVYGEMWTGDWWFETEVCAYLTLLVFFVTDSAKA